MIASRERALAEQLASITPSLDAWGCYVDHKIMELTADEFANTNFMQIAPSHRCKGELSFIRKCLYRSKNNNYPNPILDVEDKVATRVILLTTQNVATVKGLITGCQDWYHKISKDTKQFSKDNPNLFDYQSVHVVVWPREDHGEVAKEVLTCEIQIRTLLEHAYAEVTHDSVYKGSHQDNNDVKRQLSKCMALMETTDDMFCDVFRQISIKAGTSDNKFNLLLEQTTRIYNGIINGVSDYRNSDVYFLDAILYLYHEKPITIDLIRMYTGLRESDIKIAIDTNGSVLVKEPAILILFCYIEYYDDFLSAYWPLSMNILESMRQSLNFTTGSY